MAGNEPFKSTTYQVGRIPKALSDDLQGNLIFADIPNPDGVTLTQLIEGLMSGKIKFNSEGSFFSNVTTVEQALKYLNQFAYLKDTGRFILVDSTILNSKVIEGEIYNSLKDAVSWAAAQPYNGYNYFNIILMGSHKQQGVLETSTDIGVYEFAYSDTFTPITINKNGIKILGIGNPVIRLKNFNGTASSRKNIFTVDTDGLTNNISVIFDSVAFEFVDSSYTSAIWVKNAPINAVSKERSGFSLLNTSVSFVGGTNKRNRLVDFRSEATQLISNALISNLKIGSIANTESSSDSIELIYVAHHPKSILNIKDFTFGLAEQPNPLDNTEESNVTSFTGITVLCGNVVCDGIMLDEKFYWNGGLFSNVTTKLLEAFDLSQITMTNVGIIRHSFNPTQEAAGGITSIKDWMTLHSTAKVNIDGFDTYLDVDVTSPSTSGVGTSGTSGVGTSGTSGTSGSPILYDNKPVKTFWNKTKLAFGIGSVGDLRFGKLTNADFTTISTYTTEYGIPFAFNSDLNLFQYWNGTELCTIGARKTYVGQILDTQFTPISYQFPPETPTSGQEYTIIHNLNLTNQNAYVITVVDVALNRKVEPQEVLSIDGNKLKIIMGQAMTVLVTIIGV